MLVPYLKFTYRTPCIGEGLLRTYVCMYVCIYVCMYVFIYVCMYVYVRMYVMYVCVCMYVCMYVCTLIHSVDPIKNLFKRRFFPSGSIDVPVELYES